MYQGKLYGISVGPGDPELMTLKAVRYIEACPVIAAPRTAEKRSLALAIASGAVDLTGKQIEYLDLPMTRDKEALSAVHERAANCIAAHLDAGKDVAMLNLGDASLYSTYSYLCRILLGRGYEAKTIPGVTSFCACAAVLNRSLTDMDQPLHILPGSMEDLPNALDLPGGKVVMKSGLALPEIKRLIKERNLSNRAVMVSNCGLPTQKILYNIDEVTEEHYFTTILIAPYDYS